MRRFPYYKDFFNYDSNYLYKVVPKVIWKYDYKKGMMHRETYIFDQDYYKHLDVFDFKKKQSSTKTQLILNEGV